MERRVIRFLAALCASLAALGAQAQLFRTYLASDGNDANPCTLQAPCRLLPAALNAAASGGQVWILDSANFNTAPVTISKSISILAIPGAVGSIVATGGPAISIAANGLNVSLRNVVIGPVPGAGGTHGISVTGASTLTIENSVIANLPLNGIDVIGAAKVRIVDSTIRDNGQNGAYFRDGATATIHGSRLIGNSLKGVNVAPVAPGTVTRVAVSDCLVEGNDIGVYVWGELNGTGTGRITVTRSTIARNRFGVAADSPTTATQVMTLNGNTITFNDNAIGNFGGTTESEGNNSVRQNGTATQGALAPAGLI